MLSTRSLSQGMAFMLMGAIAITYTNCGKVQSKSLASTSSNESSELQAFAGSSTITSATLSSISLNYGVQSSSDLSVLATLGNSGTSDNANEYIRFSPSNSRIQARLDYTFSGFNSALPLKISYNARSINNSKELIRLQIRNFYTGSWEVLGSNTSVDNQWVLQNFSRTTKMQNYLGSSQKISLRVFATGSESISVDLLTVTQESVAPTPTPTPTVTPTPTPTPTVTPTPTPTPSATPPPSPGVYMMPPNGKFLWDWQIGASSDAAVVIQPGLKMIDLDGFNTSAAKVAEIKSKGVYTLCYLDVGSWEPGRPDSADYPAYLKIKQDPDWPQEYFLDVKDVFKANSVLAAILKKRFQMCIDKGFDGIEPDNLQNDENAGGLITLQQQIDFNGFIADMAHQMGIAIVQKNGPDKILLKDRTGKMMVEKFDGILNEECQQFSECGPLAEYVKRGKMAVNTEYKVAPNCTTSNSLVINTIRKDLNLAGGKDSGYKWTPCP